MEVVLNGMKQLPYTFLSIQLNLISLQRLNTHISSLFLQFNILDDQDLVNMVIALLLNQSTCHPDALVQELRVFFGSQTRVFLFTCNYIEFCIGIMEVFDSQRNQENS